LLPLARSAVSARFEPDRFFLRALRLIKIAPSVALVRARLFIRRSNAERIIWSGDRSHTPPKGAHHSVVAHTKIAPQQLQTDYVLLLSQKKDDSSY
jgi:hypothetical protein